MLGVLFVLAASSYSLILGIAGWVLGLLATFMATIGFLTGSSRKSVAEARDKDINSLLAHSKIQDERIAALESKLLEYEARDKAKDGIIANLLSQIKGGDELILVAKRVERRLENLEHILPPQPVTITTTTVATPVAIP